MEAAQLRVRLAQLSAQLSGIQAALRNLSVITDEPAWSVPVPVGPLALMPGLLVHTNDISMDNKLVSAKKARVQLEQKRDSLEREAHELERQLVQATTVYEQQREQQDWTLSEDGTTLINDEGLPIVDPTEFIPADESQPKPVHQRKGNYIIKRKNQPKQASESNAVADLPSRSWPAGSVRLDTRSILDELEREEDKWRAQEDARAEQEARELEKIERDAENALPAPPPPPSSSSSAKQDKDFLGSFGKGFLKQKAISSASSSRTVVVPYDDKDTTTASPPTSHVPQHRSLTPSKPVLSSSSLSPSLLQDDDAQRPTPPRSGTATPTRSVTFDKSTKTEQEQAIRDAAKGPARVFPMPATPPSSVSISQATPSSSATGAKLADAEQPAPAPRRTLTNVLRPVRERVVEREPPPPRATVRAAARGSSKRRALGAESNSHIFNEHEMGSPASGSSLPEGQTGSSSDGVGRKSRFAQQRQGQQRAELDDEANVAVTGLQSERERGQAQQTAPTTTAMWGEGAASSSTVTGSVHTLTFGRPKKGPTPEGHLSIYDIPSDDDDDDDDEDEHIEEEEADGGQGERAPEEDEFERRESEDAQNRVAAAHKAAARGRNAGSDSGSDTDGGEGGSLDLDDDDDSGFHYSDDDDEDDEDVDVDAAMHAREIALEYHKKRALVGAGRGTGPLGGDHEPGELDAWNQPWVPMDASMQGPHPGQVDARPSRFRQGPLQSVSLILPQMLADASERAAQSGSQFLEDAPAGAQDGDDDADGFTPEEREAVSRRLRLLAMDPSSEEAAMLVEQDQKAWQAYRERQQQQAAGASPSGATPADGPAPAPAPATTQVVERAPPTVKPAATAPPTVKSVASSLAALKSSVTERTTGSGPAAPAARVPPTVDEESQQQQQPPKKRVSRFKAARMAGGE